ncbi:MAG TPA: radical SAM protein, partial [Candidatus Eisenbacteria bacterium]|nr:radical SAM protein [Candidatus Eisenbacteria bacterium]
MSRAIHVSVAPSVPALALDTVWFQVAGTLCNLRCRHCFISCGPTNRSHDYMTRDSVRAHLRDAEELGVRDVYFTGGEPFLHKELAGILEDTLRVAPASVLTNATLVTPRLARELAALDAESPYSLEMRVSLDGLTPETNDPIRGEGTFAKAMRGVIKLVEHGFMPIITAARTWPDERDA